MARNPHSRWLLAAVLIWAVFAFQVHQIQFTYMRDDEEIAFRTTRSDLASTISYQAEKDVHAPLWFSSFWLWQQFVGSSEFMARVYSLLLSFITLSLVYKIGLMWFRETRTGLFAIVVLGVNSYFFIYSLEIRPYAAVMLAAAFSTWVLWRWLAQPTWRRAALYGLTLALMMYTHYFLAFLILVHILYLVTIRRLTLKLLQQGIGGAILALVLWLPWLPTFINQIQKLRSLEVGGGNARGLAGIGSTTEPTTWDALIRLLNLMSSGQILVYGLILLIGLIYWWRNHEYRLLVLWGLGVPLIALTANMVVAVYTPRYIVYLCIGFCLLLAVGFIKFGKYSFGVIGVFAIFSLWSLPSQLPTNRIPHRLIFQTISESAKPGDTIFFDQADFDNLVGWQSRRYLPPELFENRVNSLESAAKVRRVWYVTAHWFEPAIQTDFATLETSHPVQQVLGKCDRDWCYLAQLMEAPPWETPKLFGTDMLFWGHDVIAIKPDSIETYLWWRLEKTPPTDYSFSLRLSDPEGNILAQTDGPLQHYGSETVQTSAMQPQHIYIDHRTLTLPDSLPPGNYLLMLVVYDWQSGERLRLEDGSDSLTLELIVLP